MAEKPILFSGPMVSAILEGRKTQTRRIMKVKNWGDEPPASIHPDGSGKGWIAWWPETSAEFSRKAYPGPEQRGFSPPYRPGDRLWVKENYQYADWIENGLPFIRYQADGAIRGPLTPSEDMADRVWAIWEELSDPDNRAIDGKSADRKWRSSIFMPKWAARIWLEVTDVRAQRLQDITEMDAFREGIERKRRKVDWNDPVMGTRMRFRSLWNTLNAKRGYPWDSNPWVWAYTFRVWAYTFRRIEP